MNNLDSKDIYLKKDEEIIGLHAIGHKEDHVIRVQDIDGTFHTVYTDFMELDKWGNKYDQDLKMIGGSFRIYDITIDDTAQLYVDNGWEIFAPEEI